MRLTGERRKRICKVLSTYFTHSELHQLVAFSSEFTLEEVAGGPEQDLPTLVLKITLWAEKNDYVPGLVKEACDMRPRITEVITLYSSVLEWYGEELKPPTPPTVSEPNIQETLQPPIIEGHDDLSSPAEAAQNVASSDQVAPEAAKEVQVAGTSQADEDAELQVNKRFWASYVSAVIEPMMTSIPTAYYELLDGEEYPLVRVTIVAFFAPAKHVRVTSYIEGFSSHAVDTVYVRPDEKPPVQILQQPLLFHEKADSLQRLTRVSLHVIAENLDLKRVIVHRTMPVWMLAKNTFPLATYDPTTGEWKDMSRYLGAYVTPSAPRIMSFLREAAEKFPETRLLGYQDQADVDAQVKYVFEALKTIAGIKYENSLNTFNPNTGERSQRIRLPRESLEDKRANAVDSTVLFASILEALSLNPAIVVLPTHVIVGWETGPDSNTWRYLDTTKLDTRTFEEATQFGTTLAQVMEKQRADTGNERWFYRWPLRQLRGTYGIYPLE